MYLGLAVSLYPYFFLMHCFTYLFGLFVVVLLVWMGGAKPQFMTILLHVLRMCMCKIIGNKLIL